MSKSALKKELKQMSREQLEQIVLDAYDARSEIKEYFEFFLNPDVKKLLEKHRTMVLKEMSRVKWGTSKGRVSVVKKAVKEFEGFGPGVESVMDMLFKTLEIVGATERYVNLTPAQMNMVPFLVEKILVTADAAEMFSEVQERLERLMNLDVLSVYFRRAVRDAVMETIEGKLRGR